MAPSSTHEFLILGGNFAGLSVAHYLLRHTVPQLSKLDSSTSYHVTVVTPNTHVFWKIGAPRALVSPDLIPISKMFLPIADGFKGYSSETYEIVQGTATGLDPKKKAVTIELPSGGTKPMTYSTLIVATGTSGNTALWTLQGSHENTISALREMHKTLPNAKTVLIAGGGPAGTETVGEVASQYPKAKVTHLSGSTRLLERLMPSTSKDAQSRLEKLGVEVIHSLRVTSVSKGPDGGPTELTLSDGSKRYVDVYIDSTGGKTNSSFLPKSWLNERGQVLNDPKTLRSTAPGTEGVYAIGDVGSYSQGGIMDVRNAIAPLCSTIAIDLAVKIGLAAAAPKQQVFKPMNATQFVPTGPHGGVGQLFGWRVPSLMVWGIKGRTFMVEQLPDWQKGSTFLKA